MQLNYRKLLASLFLATALVANTTVVEAAPTCILMKFSDDTRYDKIEAAETLSDLVMEKLINSGKFNLRETIPVDEHLEKLLYDEKAQELYNLENAFKTQDFSVVFEGEGFSELKGQSIATAAVGQVIAPTIISSISQQHDADYLIQGTIINLGTGDWWDSNVAHIAKVVDNVSGLLGMTSMAQPLQYLGGLSMERTGVGVQCDMRLIEGKTGKVVWCKRVTSVADQKQFGIALITVGSNKLSSNLYAKAMDMAAKSIVDTLVADVDAQKLLAR